MRRIAAATAALLLTTAGVAAEETLPYTLDAVVKSYSASKVLIERCSLYYPLDRQKLEEALKQYVDIGTSGWGADAFNDALKNELVRREEEIRPVGTEDWCKYKKADYIAAGLSVLFQ
jgi:hypothetical protein